MKGDEVLSQGGEGGPSGGGGSEAETCTKRRSLGRGQLAGGSSRYKVPGVVIKESPRRAGVCRPLKDIGFYCRHDKKPLAKGAWQALSFREQERRQGRR